MHDIKEFDDREYDVILLNSALHHIILPLYQVENWYKLLKPHGKVICISEPAVSNIYCPSKKNKKWIEQQMRYQSIGNNENHYRASFYKVIFTKFEKYNFRYVNRLNVPKIIPQPFNKLLNNIINPLSRWIFPSPLSLSFIAEKK